MKPNNLNIFERHQRTNKTIKKKRNKTGFFHHKYELEIIKVGNFMSIHSKCLFKNRKKKKIFILNIIKPMQAKLIDYYYYFVFFFVSFT